LMAFDITGLNTLCSNTSSSSSSNNNVEHYTVGVACAS
jgi:hypothetical protein